MDDARKAVNLFIEKDLEKIEALAAELQSDNTDRKEVDKSITEQALALINDDEEQQQKKTTVLYRDNWHKGVVGIVASRLIDHYYRPTIILTKSNDKVSGSARSVSGFNIYEAIHACRDLLENYGGHFYAAGMTLALNSVEAFMQRFEEVVSKTIAPELLIPEIEIDAELRLADIKEAFYKIIQQFEPFGPTNLRPVFVSRHVYDYKDRSKVVKEQHLRVSIHQNDGTSIDGIGFNLADKIDIVKQGAFDIVYTIDENNFNNVKQLQIKVQDIRKAIH
jgi:single-stranded-DNA-specific exonuclease